MLYMCLNKRLFNVKINVKVRLFNVRILETNCWVTVYWISHQRTHEKLAESHPWQTLLMQAWVMGHSELVKQDSSASIGCISMSVPGLLLPRHWHCMGSAMPMAIVAHSSKHA